MATAVLPDSSADILRYMLVGAGIGARPRVGQAQGDWPLYVAVEPPNPDSIVILTDTVGRDDGRSMLGGRRFEHPGVQVKVRSRSQQEGMAKAKEIADYCDAVYMAPVVVNGTRYVVQNLSRTSPVLPIGVDAPTSKRSLTTVNLVTTISVASAELDWLADYDGTVLSLGDGTIWGV